MSPVGTMPPVYNTVAVPFQYQPCFAAAGRRRSEDRIVVLAQLAVLRGLEVPAGGLGEQDRVARAVADRRDGRPASCCPWLRSRSSAGSGHRRPGRYRCRSSGSNRSCRTRPDRADRSSCSGTGTRESSSWRPSDSAARSHRCTRAWSRIGRRSSFLRRRAKWP